MRESIGSVALYNIVMVFIVVTFAIVSGTLSYSKAFKVNNSIINAIEKYEGYNSTAGDEINSKLISLGYQTMSSRSSCQPRNNTPAMSLDYNREYEICIYKYDVPTKEWSGRYHNYGVVTYIYFDFYGLWPSVIRIPVYGVTRDIFEFNGTNN